MMQLYQRDLLIGVLRGLELIASAVRRCLEEDKKLRASTSSQSTNVTLDNVTIASYHD